jgi:hypothetical protein
LRWLSLPEEYGLKFEYLLANKKKTVELVAHASTRINIDNLKIPDYKDDSSLILLRSQSRKIRNINNIKWITSKLCLDLQRKGKIQGIKIEGVIPRSLINTA